MYSSTLPSTSALDGVGGQRHAPASLPLERPGTHWQLATSPVTATVLWTLNGIQLSSKGFWRIMIAESVSLLGCYVLSPSYQFRKFRSTLVPLSSWKERLLDLPKRPKLPTQLHSFMYEKIQALSSHDVRACSVLQIVCVCVCVCVCARARVCVRARAPVCVCVCVYCINWFISLST